MNNLSEITKLVITIGAVTIGFSNLVIFPLIDLIDPNAHLLEQILPLLKEVAGIINP